MKRLIVKSKHLIYYSFYFVLVFYFLNSEIGMPSFFSYSIDVINAIFFIQIIKHAKRIKYCKDVLIFLVFYVIYTFLTLAIIRQSIMLYLWGLRNNFRFYVFMIGCILCLHKADIIYFYSKLNIFLYINAVVASIQFILLGYSQDNIGGLFGSTSGCNGYMNVFLVICCTANIVKYILKQEKLKKCAIVIALSSYISIISELKSFFVEVGLIIIIAFLITNFSYKKIGIVLLGIASVSIIGVGIGRLYPNWANSFSLTAMKEIASSNSGYTSAGDLNRLSAIDSINRRLGTAFPKLIGTGLGSWEYSGSFHFLNSTFFKQYGNWHYQWISYAWIYLELGYIGLFAFEIFFVYLFIKNINTSAKSKEDQVIVKTAAILSIMCIFLSIYNVSLRMESAYLIYIFLAAPFILIKDGLAKCKLK